MSSIPLNYQNLLEIDTTPDAETNSYVRAAAGLSTFDPANNDETDQTKYLDGEGYSSTTVIGGQLIISVSGHRDYDDDAQNYVAGVSSEFGDSRETNVRWTDPAGNIKEGSCTLANIVDGGGDAGAKSTFSYEIHLNGKPTYTAKSEAAALSVTIAAGVTTGTTTATATAGTGNSLAYKLGASSYGTLYGQQYISGFTTYTSGDEIEAAEGQYLLILELDSNDRVVSYNETLLEAADIA